VIGIKQRTTQADWLPVLDRAYQYPNRAKAEQLVESAIAKIEQVIKPEDNVGWGWSGGKDSQALRVVMDQMNIQDSYLAISSLEYPEFLAWATNHMPERLSIVLNEKANLDWLSRNPKMLFPDTAHASRWFQIIQGSARRKYGFENEKSLIFLGRRKADHNQKPDYIENQTRVFSPIFDWSHEDVLTVLGAYQMSLPPCYWWPRGFQVGTGSWAARQWTGSAQNGWAEIWQIDPRIVENAAKRIDSARIFLDTQQPQGS
jgi:3'-phosphoadenosine 5'-phosphosulfate sulfotransferase (PAPS reductase)/FAD synthetase